MVTLRTTLVILLFAALNLNAQTIINGGAVSGIWESAGNPYIIENNIFVGPDDRLTIKSGVEVLFTGNYSLEVLGRLDATGTENENIIFTLEDTTGFASGAAGWKGIIYQGFPVSNPEFSNLNHCIVEYSAENGISCIDFSLLEINNSIVRYNKNTGVALHEFSDIQVNGIEIHHNGTGGMELNFSSPQVTNFIIEYNNGPAIIMNGSFNGGLSPLFEHGEIRNNYSSSNGGGLQLNFDYSIQLNDVNIYQNSAVKGGGIFSGGGHLSMENVNIRSNDSESGGGMYIDYGSVVEMDLCVLADNTTAVDGGAIYLVESDLDVKRSTISNNSAGNEGGGLFYKKNYGQPGIISSSIVWGNFPEGIYTTSINPEINYSNVSGGYSGINNIDEDPLFENAETGNYNLLWTDYPTVNGSKSPCIDAGDPEIANDPDGTVADMGAYYFNQEVMTQINNRFEEKFTVYPNPATHTINLSGNTRMQQVSIVTLTGHVVKELSGTLLQSAIDIGSIKSGIYIVMVVWEDGQVSTEKLIKE